MSILVLISAKVPFEAASLATLPQITTLPSITTLSPILQLPREIRDRILELMILTPRQSPQDACHRERDCRVEVEDFNPTGYFGGYGIRYETDDNLKDLRAILAVNKQFRSETIAAMRRVPKNFVLDILVVEEMDLWPTWVLVPCMTNYMNSLRMNIRMAAVLEI